MDDLKLAWQAETSSKNKQQHRVRLLTEYQILEMKIALRKNTFGFQIFFDICGRYHDPKMA